MKLPSYMRVSRHGVYCYRQRVPLDLLPIFNLAEIRCSLRTKDRRAAISLARHTALRVDVAFERLRNMPKKPDSELLITELMVEIVSGPHRVRLDYDPSKPEERAEADRVRREYSASAHAGSEVVPAPPSVVSSKKVSELKELIDQFLSDSEVKKRLDKPATVRKDRDALKAFSGIVGPGTRADQIGQHEAVRFSEHLTGRGLAANTINNHMGSVSKFSKWIRGRRPDVRHEILDFKVLRVKNRARSDEERDAFQPEEVKTILCASGTLDARKKAPHKYWMPWIAAYTGMRTEEIAQLNPQTDFFVDNSGLWVIDINASEGKQLKNKTSQRHVPVHHALLARGLGDYVQELRQSGARSLFPSVGAYDGRFAKNAARPANRHIKSLGINKTLHCFRHTVANQLKQLGVDEMYTAALLGHGHGGITYRRYGKPLTPEVVYRKAVSVMTHRNLRRSCR